MKVPRSMIGFTAVLLLALGGSAGTCGQKSQRAIWVSAYLRAVKQDIVLPVSEIDFGAFTHLIHFSVRPRSDGTLDVSAISAASSQEVVQAAHAVGGKVLLCAGGSDTGAAWAPAIADPATRSALVDALLAMVTDRNYDGIDLDFEPLDPARLGDPSLLANFGAFVDELHARLAPQGLLLTAAPGPTSLEAGFYAARQAEFDQINVQTYNLSGVSTKETWHNSALTSGGAVNWSNGQPLPSCESKLQLFRDAGAAPGKLGLGIDFNGKTWAGASGPQQMLTGVSPPQPISYAQVMDTLYSSSAYHWDDGPKVPWILVAGSSPAFVSYDDERSVAAKIDYLRSQRLGGAMIWELSAGYRPGQPPGLRDALLQAIKKAAGR